MTTTTLSPTPAPTTVPLRLVVALALWAATALTISALGVITVERGFLVPITLVSTTLALVVLYHRSPSVRALARGVDLRVPILFHVIRAPIGASFLVLVASGLDADFARIGGWGDIVSGLLALVAAASVGRAQERNIVRAWNVIALADIVATVATAQRILLFSDHPQTMSLLTRFPFALLPLFIVPLVLATHFLIFARLRTARV